MRRLAFIVIMQMALVAFIGCRDGSTSKLLMQAEAFLPMEADSADARLNLIPVNGLAEEERPLYALLRIATDYLLADSIDGELAHCAYDFYATQSQRGSSADKVANRRFGQAALYMGEWYVAQDSTKAGDDCYRQAIRTSEQVEDWHTCYIAYHRLSVQVHFSNDKKALELIEKAIEIYGKINDSPKNLISLYLFAADHASSIAYIEDTDDYTSAIAYANQAYQLAVDSGWTDNQHSALITLAMIYWCMNDYTTALDYAKRVEISEHLDSEIGITTNLRIAQFYFSCDSTAQAKQILHMPHRIDDPTLAYLYARLLAEIAVRQQEPDTAAFYLDSAFTCSEALYINSLKVKDDYYNQTLEHEKTQMEMRTQARHRMWAAVAALLVLVVLLLQWRHYERKQHRLATQHLNRENELLSHERELLQDRVQKKEGMIRFLQGYIIDRLDVAKKLQTETDTHVTLSRKDWLDIERVLNEIDDNCIERVRAACPHLSQDDLRLCMLVRLRMSNPVIGRIYSITPSAVQHRKQRLKKEGFGITDPNRLLEDVIASV